MADQSSFVPPHSLEAEKSTLGSLLVDKDSIVQIGDFLRPEDFYHDAHKMVYQAITDLYDKRSPIDLVTLTNVLEERKELKLIGGASYLALLANEVPTATHIFQYATIVKEKAILRKLILVGDRIKGMGYQEGEEIETLLDTAEKELFGVSQTFISDRFVHVKDVLNKTYEKISDLHDPEAKEKYRGLSTGFKSLDNLLSGFQPSDLVILAARPSMGKTAFALNITQNIAKKGKSVGLISLEMSKEQLVERMFCSLLAVDSWKMRTGKLTDDDFAKIGSVMDEMNSMKIFIDDSIGNSIAELKAKARRLKMEHGLDMLVIDYLQLMTSGNKGGFQSNRVQEISEISRSLKALARELHIPVVALSQLSRAVEMRPSKIPQLSDLRECVTGDTEVSLADGSTAAIKDLLGKTVEVMAVDQDRKIVKALSEKVWKVGKKPVYKVTLESGREIKCSEGHRILSDDGWKELGELSQGDRVGVAHKLPEPKDPLIWSDHKVILLGQMIGDGSYLKGQPMRYTTNSEENSKAVKDAAEEFGCRVTRYKGRRNWHQLLISGNGNRWKPAGINKWFRDLGIFNQRSHEKRIPADVFRLPNRQIAILLKHLWATDGTIFTRPRNSKGSNVIHLSTTSYGLVEDVLKLLLRFGIVGRINRVKKGSYKPNYMVFISGVVDQKKFLKNIGTFGPRKKQGENLLDALKNVIPNTNVDSLPKRLFARVKKLMDSQGITQRQMATLRGTVYAGSSHFDFAPSRAVIEDYANILDDEGLRSYCRDDIFWGRIKKIEYLGVEDVYDLTVPGPASWLTKTGICCHNSGAIEQDADVVMMMYREDYYEEDSDRKGVTDVYVRKHRNGPIGHIELAFKKAQMKFLDIEKHRDANDYAAGF